MHLGRVTSTQLAITLFVLSVAAWAAWHWGPQLPHSTFLNEWMPNLGVDFAIIGFSVLVLDRAVKQRERLRRRPQIEAALRLIGSNLFFLSLSANTGFEPGNPDQPPSDADSFAERIAKWKEHLATEEPIPLSARGVPRAIEYAQRASSRLDHVENRFGPHPR